VDLRLSGKIALVTGASSGIGAATAGLLAAEGADVVVVSYSGNAAGAERTADEVRSLGREALLLRMDVGDPEAVASAVAELDKKVSGLDVAVLCAGINVITPFERLTPAEWDQVVRVNLNGTFYVLHAIVPLLRDSAAVVTVASVAAKASAPASAAASVKPAASAAASASAKPAASAATRIPWPRFVAAILECAARVFPD